jgi:uncharacterized membrane protein HdeD (DUF308 family)
MRVVLVESECSVVLLFLSPFLLLLLCLTAVLMPFLLLLLLFLLLLLRLLFLFAGCVYAWVAWSSCVRREGERW